MTAPDSPPTRPASRLVLVAAVAGAVLAVALVVALLRGDEQPPDIEARADPVTDLLAWLPATDETRRAFAVWTSDPGPTPEVGAAAPDLSTRLAVEPRPRVLGASRGWKDQFGWSVAEITAWAAAGRGGEIAVLEGGFAQDAIVEALERSGYDRAGYRGIDIFQLVSETVPGQLIDGDDMAAANVVALIGDRIVASADPELVRHALDAAIDGKGSLADEPPIVSNLPRLAPLSGLVAIDQADHALACDFGRSAADAPIDQYVLVAYGRLGEGGERRTSVVTTYVNEQAAVSDFGRIELEWLNGSASAGAAAGSLSAFGTVSNVGQAGSAIIVTLIDGRDEGWVRAGIRFASPICATALAAVPDLATPAPVTRTAVERARAALGDPGTVGHLVVVDLAGIQAARALAVPGSALRPADVSTWWAALAPLPALAAFPAGAASVAEWAGIYRIAPAELSLIAELRGAADAAPVGVMIGGWDSEPLHHVLRAAGYESIAIGDVQHYAHRSLAPDSPWRNVAVLGDHLWYSADQRAMRRAVDMATGERAPDVPDVALVDALESFLVGATTMEITGVEFDLRKCPSTRGPVAGSAVVWRASDERGEAALLPLASGELDVVALGLDLLGPGLARWTAVDRATPVANQTVEQLRISLQYAGVEVRRLDSGTIVVANFVVVGEEPPPDWFFVNAADGCRLTR